ncbi:hypothetical protein CAEBREN_01531 [Caenorhabditis brenneri]|uniref:Uncharacterized protein n=1 Tax=Caenorhabditis brenneri TaxID=135651 RepID=G0N1B0_CAEBE|nr:hypothetical protein CAEBREN_01531 [Caenorhabditis brenneri]
MDTIRREINTIKQGVRSLYNERFTQLMGAITAFFFILWVAAAIAVHVNPEAPTNLKYIFPVICVLGWAASIMMSIFVIEIWLREPQVRRPYDPLRDGNPDAIPLGQRGLFVAAPLIAQH